MGTSVKGWGQFRPSTPRQVARGARSGRHNGAEPSCHNQPSDQRGHRKRRGARGGRPVGYDYDDYKGRNVVERGFNETKQWRGLATRYDKLALTYRGGVVLRAITLWLKATTP